MEKAKKVVVGISGGVDSSVTALLLKNAGFDVQGIFMKNWTNSAPNIECTTEADFKDAEEVCDQIGIPLHMANFSSDYWDKVFKRFLSDHHEGLTPNPDILCNKEIKFRAFLDYCMEIGADYIATGHYAKLSSKDGTTKLLRGMDTKKDQSYFLHQVTGEDLSKTIFPLGELTKEEVIKIATDNNLITSTKKDSVGICFIGKNNYNNFISNFLGKKPGQICDEAGIVLGEHDGLMYFTLGQRQGIGLGGVKGRDQDSWYVAHKDLKTNELSVVQGAEHPLLYSDGCYVDDIHWINDFTEVTFDCYVQIRYQSPAIKAQVTKAEKGYKIIFEEQVLAVTPGQSAVIYRDNECLGGSIIRDRISENYYKWAENRGYNYEVYG
ncbi:MAG: tRNA 2-thiouridine(34) synthase MnmA [Pseudomonadota bacterium]|nr:tRNA 2-thiouridine(34) synthase MnmA [Pseudomonadota bacterium]